MVNVASSSSERFSTSKDSLEVVSNYFAYGSNMSKTRLENRVGVVAHLGTAVLKGYEFLFNKRSMDGSGKANLHPKKGAEAHGVVYALSQEQFDKLDQFEGAPNHYSRKVVEVFTPEEEVLEAIAYIAKKAYITDPIRPTEEYLGHILRGAEENGFARSLFSFKEFFL
jgi:gamma-glutamylcyclotransferase